MTLFNRPGLPAHCDELSTAFQRARPTNQTVRPQYRYNEDTFGEVFDQLRSFCISYPIMRRTNIISTSITGSLYYIPFLTLSGTYPVIPAREQNENVSQAFTLLVNYQSTGKTTCFGVYLPMGSWWSSSVALMEALHMRRRCTRTAPLEWWS